MININAMLHNYYHYLKHCLTVNISYLSVCDSVFYICTNPYTVVPL